MTLDIGAIYGVNGTPNAPDAGQIIGNALKIKQFQGEMQRQNTLKTIFGNPQNIGPDGLPTDQAVAEAWRVDPAQAEKVEGLKSQVEERKAMTDQRRQKEFVDLDNFVQSVVRGPATEAYQKALKDGLPEEAARAAGQKVYDEGIAELKSSGRFGTDQINSFDPKFDPARVATRTKMNALANQPKSGDVETLTNNEGVTFDHNKLTGKNTVVSAPDDSGLKAGDEYSPTGGVQKIGGGGMARSAIAMATQRYVQEHPNATADDIAEFAAQYKRTQVAGAADVEAGAASLKNIEKTRGMVRASEGNANKEADLVLSLVDKGGGNLPRFFNKPLQDLKVQGLGNTDAAALRVATESFKNEYVKVLSTQSGVSGGQSTDSARKEADAFINDGLSIDQIKRNIEIMRKSMNNRSAALDEAYQAESSKVQRDKPGPARPASDKGGRYGASVSYLRAHDSPEMRKYFDAKYGAGAAERELGQ